MTEPKPKAKRKPRKAQPTNADIMKALNEWNERLAIVERAVLKNRDVADARAELDAAETGRQATTNTKVDHAVFGNAKPGLVAEYAGIRAGLVVLIGLHTVEFAAVIGLAVYLIEHMVIK